MNNKQDSNEEKILSQALQAFYDLSESWGKQVSDNYVLATTEPLSSTDRLEILSHAEQLLVCSRELDEVIDQMATGKEI